MPKQDVINSVPVSFRMPEPLFQRIKHLARREALLRDADVSFADLVRGALAEAYPPEEGETPMIATEEELNR